MKNRNFKQFFFLGITAICINANAGFFSSYVLGVPTSLSAKSIAGAALSPSNSETNSEDDKIQEKQINLVGLNPDKKIEKVSREISQNDFRISDRDVTLYSFELKPNEIIKFKYEWKDPINSKEINELDLKDFSQKIKEQQIENLWVIAQKESRLKFNKEENYLKVINTNSTPIKVILSEQKNVFLRNRWYIGDYDKTRLEVLKEKEQDDKNGIVFGTIIMGGIFSLLGYSFISSHMEEKRRARIIAEGERRRLEKIRVPEEVIEKVINKNSLKL